VKQRALLPLKTVLEAAMDVLDEHASGHAMHPLCCVCALCHLKRAVQYQQKPCGLSTCDLRRHEHHNRDHAFCEEPSLKTSRVPKSKNGRRARARRLQEIANRE
jgi:hypothetical protein